MRKRGGRRERKRKKRSEERRKGKEKKTNKTKSNNSQKNGSHKNNNIIAFKFPVAYLISGENINMKTIEMTNIKKRKRYEWVGGNHQTNLPISKIPAINDKIQAYCTKRKKNL